jgi:importin-11
MPLIQESLRPEVRSQGVLREGVTPLTSCAKVITHLDQDGLDLWLSALRNTVSDYAIPRGVPSLLDLAPAGLHLLANNLDLLGTIVSIIEAYFLLDASALLQVINRLSTRPRYCISDP